MLVAQLLRGVADVGECPRDANVWRQLVWLIARSSLLIRERGISGIANMSVNAQLISLVNEFGVGQRRNEAFCKRVVSTLE